MKNVLLALFCIAALVACNKPEQKVAEPETAETKTPAQSEFADPKYTEIGKQGISQLSSGDVDGWMNSFADNAVYAWSSGDSIAGKKAISDYWKERRGKAIDSISFVNDIWLPLKVNQSQRGPDLPGNWLLSWYQVKVKSKNGKKLLLPDTNSFEFKVCSRSNRRLLETKNSKPETNPSTSGSGSTSSAGHWSCW